MPRRKAAEIEPVESPERAYDERGNVRPADTRFLPGTDEKEGEN